jgi:sec-independent protein translocase protein TatA
MKTILAEPDEGLWRRRHAPHCGALLLVLSTTKELTVFFGDIFGPDLLVVVIVVAVLIFGGAAIPKLARNLGSAKTEFEKGLKEGKTGNAPASDTTETKASDTDK